MTVSGQTGGTNWGELIQGWNELAMDWYQLVTQRTQPAPPTVLGQLTGADLNRPVTQNSGAGLILLAAVGVAAVLLLRK